MLFESVYTLPIPQFQPPSSLPAVRQAHSKNPFIGKAVKTGICNNDVIKHPDVHHLAGVSNFFCQVDVLLAWLQAHLRDGYEPGRYGQPDAVMPG